MSAYGKQYQVGTGLSRVNAAFLDLKPLSCLLRRTHTQMMLPCRLGIPHGARPHWPWEWSKAPILQSGSQDRGLECPFRAWRPLWARAHGVSVCEVGSDRRRPNAQSLGLCRVARWDVTQSHLVDVRHEQDPDGAAVGSAIVVAHCSHSEVDRPVPIKVADGGAFEAEEIAVTQTSAEAAGCVRDLRVGLDRAVGVEEEDPDGASVGATVVVVPRTDREIGDAVAVEVPDLEG